MHRESWHDALFLVFLSELMGAASQQTQVDEEEEGAEDGANGDGEDGSDKGSDGDGSDSD